MQVNAVRLAPSSGTAAVQPATDVQVERISPQAPAAVSAAELALAQQREAERLADRAKGKGRLIDVEA